MRYSCIWAITAVGFALVAGPAGAASSSVDPTTHGRPAPVAPELSMSTPQPPLLSADQPDAVAERLHRQGHHPESATHIGEAIGNPQQFLPKASGDPREHGRRP